MTPDSAQSATTRRLADALQSEAQEAVETFTFDVSAGKKVTPPARETAASAVQVDLPQLSKPAKSVQFQPVSPSDYLVAPVETVKAAEKHRRMPAWMGSVLFHAAVILPM